MTKCLLSCSVFACFFCNIQLMQLMNSTKHNKKLLVVPILTGLQMMQICKFNSTCIHSVSRKSMQYMTHFFLEVTDVIQGISSYECQLSKQGQWCISSTPFQVCLPVFNTCFFQKKVFSIVCVAKEKTPQVSYLINQPFHCFHLFKFQQPITKFLNILKRVGRLSAK